MKTKSWVQATGVVAGLLLAGTVSAAGIILSGATPLVNVSVATRVDNQMAADELSLNTRLMYGSSTASPLGASAWVEPDSPWPNACSQGNCGTVTSVFAHARGEFNADLGRIRSVSTVGVTAESGAAQAIVGVTDVVTFGPLPMNRPQLKLHIDLDSRAGTSIETRSHSRFEFAVSLSRHACDTDMFPDGCGNTVFYFEALDYGGSAIDSWFYARDAHNAHLAEGVSVPAGGLDVVIDLTDLNEQDVQLFTEYDLGIFSRSYSECAARSDAAPQALCSTDMDASHTVHVGITNLLTSTFSYPGLVVTDPGTVPEPASLPLVMSAIGLAAVGTVRPRRRQAR